MLNAVPHPETSPPRQAIHRGYPRPVGDAPTDMQMPLGAMQRLTPDAAASGVRRLRRGERTSSLLGGGSCCRPWRRVASVEVATEAIT